MLLRARILAVILSCLLLVSVGIALADAPQTSNENQLVIRSDGFIYLVRDGARHLVVPISLPDDDINAMPEKEPYLDGLMAVGSTMTSDSASQAAAPQGIPTVPNPNASESISAGPVKVSLGDYSIDLNPATVKAGKVTFNVQNEGKMRHELILFRSELDTATLPVSSNKVDEAAVGKKIGELEGFKPGDSQTSTFSLDAGHYVLLCNISGHYTKGMVSSLDVK
jgi:uncharacterized cupredoxin-like copper-binding protein